MGPESDNGRKRPNGRKIRELRKEKGLKQEALAETAYISVRLLRDIERNDHPVQTTTMTAIAAALKVDPANITLSTPDGSPTTNTNSLLKLRVVRSATELSRLASSADEYEWSLMIDPSTATAADMQAVMITVHRLVKKYGRLPQDATWWDEFDEQKFGEIPRLARLQDLLTRLGASGVNVVAAIHTYSSVKSLEESEIPELGFIVRAPDKTTKQVFTYVTDLKIHFVPGDVEELVVPIYSGQSLEDFEIEDSSLSALIYGTEKHPQG
jgi:transcriptional regulator with XRE-family HTH domain